MPPAGDETGCRTELYAGSVCSQVLVNWQSCALGLVTVATVQTAGSQAELEAQLTDIVTVLSEQM